MAATDSVVTTAGATPEFDPVATVAEAIEPGTVADAAVAAEVPLCTAETTEALAGPDAVAAPAVLAVSEAPLTDAPTAAAPVIDEVPAVEPPLITPVAEEAPDTVAAAAEAELVTDAPEIEEPDTEPVAVAGRLAVLGCDCPEIAVDAPVPAAV